MGDIRAVPYPRQDDVEKPEEKRAVTFKKKVEPHRWKVIVVNTVLVVILIFALGILAHMYSKRVGPLFTHSFIHSFKEASLRESCQMRQESLHCKQYKMIKSEFLVRFLV